MEQIENNECCNCLCHAPGSNMEHIMACCVECKCGQRIKTKYWEEHMASCDAMSEDYSRKQRSENSTKRIASFVDVHSDKSIRRL